MHIILRNDYTVVSCHDLVANVMPAGERPETGILVVHLLLDPQMRLMAAYWRKADCLARCVDGLTCATFFVN